MWLFKSPSHSITMENLDSKLTILQQTINSYESHRIEQNKIIMEMLESQNELLRTNVILQPTPKSTIPINIEFKEQENTFMDELKQRIEQMRQNMGTSHGMYCCPHCNYRAISEENLKHNCNEYPKKTS